MESRRLWGRLFHSSRPIQASSGRDRPVSVVTGHTHLAHFKGAMTSVTSRSWVQTAVRNCTHINTECHTDLTSPPPVKSAVFYSLPCHCDFMTEIRAEAPALPSCPVAGKAQPPTPPIPVMPSSTRLLCLHRNALFLQHPLGSFNSSQVLVLLYSLLEVRRTES